MRIPIAAMLLACAAVPARAEDAAAPDNENTFSVLFENDIFFGTDRDYTNGVLFTYTQAPDETPNFAVRAARWLPFFDKNGEVRSGYEFGQNIYTPEDKTAVIPPPGSRPYAGYLYLGMGLVAAEADRLDQLQLQLGIVGPASMARQTQAFVHGLINDEKPRGWDTQLRNEPAFELTYERSWRAFASGRLLGFSFDFAPDAGIALGNVYDYANAGAMLRVGFDLPDDYGPLRIDPSLPGSSFYTPTGDFSWYAFAGVDGRAVGHNIFLDGNSFETSRHAQKNPLVGDLDLGVAIAFRSVRLSFTHTFRTEEYRGQPGMDQYGAVNLSIRL
jgi:hypothetical protein